MYQLSQEPTFQNRVQASLVAACIAISNEGWSIPFHRERSDFATRVLLAPNGTTNYVGLFSNAVATDALVIGDATQAGTVVLSSGNRATQAALVTDAHIDSAISAMFNSFVREPAN
jgi:microcompartment protein CcmK/EutM